MSYSTNDCSDSGEADELQSHSGGSVSYSTSLTGAPGALHTSSYLPYPVLPPVGALGQASYPPYPDPYYISVFPPYDPQSYCAQPYPPQPMLMGMHQAGLPLPSDAVDEPIFVNAKQYHGILRRRQSRAKAESENKAMKNRKPYLHESRHLHALKRARGCGGRFLNEKKGENHVSATAASNGKQVCEVDLASTRGVSTDSSS